MDNKPLVSLHTDYNPETIEKILIPGPKLDEKGRLNNLHIFYDYSSDKGYVVSVNEDKCTPIFTYNLKSLEFINFHC